MNLAEFAKWAIENSSFEGCDLDGGYVQEKAVELGILTRTKFDPDVHGEPVCDVEPGDEWFVFSDEFKTAIRQG